MMIVICLAMIFTLALAYGAVIILEVSGNLALIIIILKQKEMRNVTNVTDCEPFLLRLACGHHVSSLHICLHADGPPGFLVRQCASWTPLYSAFPSLCPSSLWSLSPSGDISWLSVGWRPSNRHAYVGIAVIWVLAVASSLPFLIYQVLTDEPFQNVTLGQVSGQNTSALINFHPDSHRLSYTTLLLVLQYFGPLCFIFICYFKGRKTFSP